VGGTAILTSLTAPQFTTIELSHATENTLSAASGVLSIEGVAIPTISSADTLSNKTLTAPKFADLGYLADANGNEILILDTVASAVNEITLANAATTTNPSITASGGDANIGLDILLKGTGTLNLKGNATQPAELRLYEDTDLGTNYSAFKVGTQAADITYTLPTAVGAAGTYLKDVAGDGVLSWATPAGGAAKCLVPWRGTNRGNTDAVMYMIPSTLSETEAYAQMPTTAGTYKNLYINVRANTCTSASTVTFRVNGADSTLTISIAAGATGVKSDTTHTVAVNAGDLINISETANGAGGTLDVAGAAIEFDPS
jgi:hypothetical protein